MWEHQKKQTNIGHATLAKVRFFGLDKLYIFLIIINATTLHKVKLSFKNELIFPQHLGLLSLLASFR